MVDVSLHSAQPFGDLPTGLMPRLTDLGLISLTHVCDIRLGVRPGLFINPYRSCWGSWLENFVRAGVQVWVVWGPEVIQKKPTFLSPRSKLFEDFLPPLDLIKSVRSKSQESEAFQLISPFLPPSPPSATTYVVSQPPPSSSAPSIPPPNSRQRRGETLAEFLVRLEEGKRKREASETPSEAQSRRDRENSAIEKGYSKSSTVFIWEETAGHYLRVKVDRGEVPAIWSDYPASRRVYHSHVNEWDLCPPIPPFSETLTQQDIEEIQQYDDELDAFNSAPTTLKAPSDQFAAQHSGHIDELASLVSPSQPNTFEFDIIEHLKDRYGYDVFRQPSWTPNLHDEKVADVDAAKTRFLFRKFRHPTILAPAIENFCNAIANKQVRVHNLPQSWDLSRLQLQIPGLQLSSGSDVENRTMYAISSTTAEEGHWVICLKDPTTVLQIYRNRWTTLNTIVEELVLRGIPFNTGVPEPSNGSNLVDTSCKSKGLGLRPLGYRPQSDDYHAYLLTRAEALRSTLGRAALLQGGLIARLARDIVGVSDVLSGPEASNGKRIGAVTLVDDQLSDYMLDVISGVYYVETKTDKQIHQHLSFWPKLGWKSSGYYTEEWTADAESWYQDRLKALESGSAPLHNSTDWKSKLRAYKGVTQAFLADNHRLSKSVIDRHMSYASFPLPLI